MTDRQAVIAALRADAAAFPEQAIRLFDAGAFPNEDATGAGAFPDEDATDADAFPDQDAPDAGAFPDQDAPDAVTARGRDRARARLARAETPEAFEGPRGLDEFESFTDRERDLTWRLWVLDGAPLGLTLAGPAYQDTPVRYANQTVERLTGYPRAAICGDNLRLLQGPETAAEAVAKLREAVRIWEPVTVTLINYRRDGTPFHNRVSLVPMTGADGTVVNWIGIQQRVDPSGTSGSI